MSDWSDFYFRFDSSQLSQCLAFLEPRWQEGWTSVGSADLPFVVLNKALVSLKLGMVEAAQSEIDSCATIFGFARVDHICRFFYQLRQAVNGNFWLVNAAAASPVLFEIPFTILTGLIICQAEIFRHNSQHIDAAETLRLYSSVCRDLHRFPWSRICRDRGVNVVPSGWASDSALKNVACLCELRAATMLCQFSLEDARRFLTVLNTGGASAKILLQKICIELADKEACLALQRALELEHPSAAKVGGAFVDVFQKSSTGHLKCGEAAETLLARIPVAASSLAARSLALVALKNLGVVSLCVHSREIGRASELSWLALADMLDVQVVSTPDKLPTVAVAAGGRKTCVVIPSILRNTRALNRFLPSTVNKDTLMRQLLSEVAYGDKETLITSFSRL